MRTNVLGCGFRFAVINKQNRTLWLLGFILVLTVFITSCAIGYRYALRSKVTYEEVFAACLEATKSIGFQVKSSNAAKGEIRAEKHTLVGGRSYGGGAAQVFYTTQTIELQIVREPGGTKIHVRMLPVGQETQAKITFDTFSSALASRIRDVEVLPKE